ncbi:DMT family transporter [Sphingobium algorifonticola]|uniref:DMT family transporter n=1 Tax=Sphingobium algorifonticola TaxID=2008318 RepID=A0A437JDJ1_9SPHN|nr:DMT family transporter [Sphingobium algorifonticola]RVT43760.1 DMT family transporter [Sphingobium algorifonticola]
MSVSIATSEETAAPAPPRFAFLALFCGNVALAFGPLLVRLADIGPVAAGFWRLSLAVPLLMLLARWRGHGLSGISRSLWPVIALGGLFFAADLASWHAGIMLTKVANATLFGNITSLLLPIWGIVVLRQRPGRLQGIAIALAVAGTALLMGNSYELSPRYLRGDLLCILAGVLYTGYILSIQRVRQVLDSWSLLAASTIAAAVPMLVFAWAAGETILPTDWTPVIVLALLSQVIGQGLVVYALAWFTPLIVGLTLLVQPLVGALIGWLAFGETLSLTDAVGACAIALALVLVRLPVRD